MFKEHPKGLLAAALANMGERFGFYTMMAILVLFLQAKFGLDGTNAGIIYSVFYASIYILALVGGLIADKTRNYKGTILIGLVIMAIGYFLISIPTTTPIPESSYVLMLVLTCMGLFVIAFGNGLFKGNLQALVGQMYDNNEYSKMRDAGFQWFYMFINVGAIFAPLAAVGVRNWWLGTKGFAYNADLPALCHSQLGNTIKPDAAEKFTELASKVSGQPVTDLTAFSNDYLNAFTTGFHYAFGVAIIAMVISLTIYIANKRRFPDPKVKTAKADPANTANLEMDIKEVKQRLYALFAVFGIVIFFWFSFHQNGLTLTYFAKEYTDLSQMKLSLGFTTLQGAELFQSINPFFVVFLTPIIMAFFGFLRVKGIEPSTPKKIAIGMGIAALGFVVMAIGSYVSELPLWSSLFEKIKDPETGKTVVNTIRVMDVSEKVSPFLLIGTYFILTVAELFISPLGISFVSKVAPPKYQGIMQGGWLGATALGNQLLFIGAILYQAIPIWLTWTVFVVACVLSMFTMIFMLKWLERVAR